MVGLSGGLVGLTLTYAMALMGLFQWGVRQSAEVENQVRHVGSGGVTSRAQRWCYVTCVAV